MAKKKVTTTTTVVEEEITESPRKVHALFILDESGSMGTIQEPTISTFNAYIDGLKETKSVDYLFTLTIFDSTQVRTPYRDVPIKRVEHLDKNTYKPNASTPLYDAVCGTIMEVERSVGTDPALAIILTDGYENSSTRYKKTDMEMMIKRLQDKGNWTFVYLGANQDAMQVGQSYRMPSQNTYTWTSTSGGLATLGSNLTNATLTYSKSVARGENATMDFFVPEKSSDEKTPPPTK